jgi:hypothetical protein
LPTLLAFQKDRHIDNPDSISTPTRRTILAATAGVVATPLQFGLRAVDRQGHRSPAAAPVPTN